MRQSILKNDFLPLLRLALPLVITGIIQSSLFFFETIFLSRLGETVMAAGALVGWLFATLIVILFGTFSAVNILIAHKYGAKDQASIVLVLRDGLLLAILLTIPTFILFWNISPILSHFGQSAQLVELARDCICMLEEVSIHELRKVWRESTQCINRFGEASIYLELLKHIREINFNLSNEKRFKYWVVIHLLIGKQFIH